MRARSFNDGLEKLHEERDHLKILINLLENGDEARDSEIEAARAKLKELERCIDATFRDATDPPSARWRQRD